MSESIQVHLSSDRVVLEPGAKTEIVATIQNTGDVVEVFSIEIGGIEPDWYSLPVSSVSLFPGDKEEIRIAFSPPPATASKAGSYDVSVKASSKRDPTVMNSAKTTLEIGSVASYDLTISPKKVRARKGSYQVAITNTGNATNTYKLEASDASEDCIYEFKSDTIVVEPGATTDAPLTVNPRKKPFTGAAKPFAFNVKASPYGQAPEIKTIDAQLECPARIPKWGLYAIIGGIVAIVVVVVLVIVFTGSKGPGTLPMYESFEIEPQHFIMYEVQTAALGQIEVDTEWSGADRLSLVLYGPKEGQAASARSEDVSPLTISYDITSEDAAEGDTWRIYVANLDNANDAIGGTISITYQP